MRSSFSEEPHELENTILGVPEQLVVSGALSHGKHGDQHATPARATEVGDCHLVPIGTNASRHIVLPHVVGDPAYRVVEATQHKRLFSLASVELVSSPDEVGLPLNSGIGEEGAAQTHRPGDLLGAVKLQTIVSVVVLEPDDNLLVACTEPPTRKARYLEAQLNDKIDISANIVNGGHPTGDKKVETAGLQRSSHDGRNPSGAPLHGLHQGLHPWRRRRLRLGHVPAVLRVGLVVNGHGAHDLHNGEPSLFFFSERIVQALVHAH